ncbi:hypothetical protein V1511DRAFT_458187 [Dipodascopsis uninucleata]
MCPNEQKIFIYGGFDYTRNDELFNSVIYIDTANMKSTQVSSSSGQPPCARHGHTATYWKEGKLIIFGGENERNVFLNDIHIYDLNLNEWSTPITNGQKPLGRSRHAACLSEDGKRIYFCGGMRQHIVMSDIFCLDLESLTWSDSHSFVARYDHVSTVFEDKLWVFGGLTDEMRRASDILWFDLKTSAVTSLRFDSSNSGDDQESIDGRNITGRNSRRGTPNNDRRAGLHFYAVCGSVVVDFMTHGPAIHNTATSISSFNLKEMRWRTLVNGANDIFAGFWWSYVASTATTAYIIGSPTHSESPNNENEYLCTILPIDLKYYGILSTPRSTKQGLLDVQSLNIDIACLFNDSDSSDFIITAIPDDVDSAGCERNTFLPEDQTSVPTSDPIYVHSLILNARWPHFRRLSNSRMREYHRRRMHIPEAYSTVRALLYYLYSDTIATEESVETISKVLILCNLYGLPRLRDMCVARIQDYFSVDFAAIVWECAKIAQEDNLRALAAKFCLKHWGRVVRSKGFKGLSKSSMLELCEEVDLEGQVIMGTEDHNYNARMRSLDTQMMGSDSSVFFAEETDNVSDDMSLMDDEDNADS